MYAVVVKHIVYILETFLVRFIIVPFPCFGMAEVAREISVSVINKSILTAYLHYPFVLVQRDIFTTRLYPTARYELSFIT